MLSKAKLVGKRLRLLGDITLNTGHVSARYQTVMIETTSTCNLDCPICPARRSDNIMERASKQISLADMRMIVDRTRNITDSYCLNMWGEPLLHKEFKQILDYVSSAGLPIWFSSNLNYSTRLAEMLAEYPLVNIICSLDGWDAESYAEYRWGGRFDVLKTNLAILAKGKCKIYPQYLIGDDGPETERRKEMFVSFVKEIVGSTENVFFKRKFEDLRNDTDAVVPGRCSSMYAGLYFNSDGTLMPCCTNVRKDVMLRHISAYETADLVNGGEVKALRKSILSDKNKYDSCKSCGGEDHQKLITSIIKTRVKEMFAPQKRVFPGSSKGL